MKRACQIAPTRLLVYTGVEPHSVEDGEMSVSAAQASAFYREVSKHRAVWTVRDVEGFPAPKNGSGERSMPFWSLRTRAEAVVSNVPAYSTFEVHEISLAEFRDRWLPGLEKDGVLVGVNWSGEHATGYDIEPGTVASALADSLARTPAQS